MLSTFFFIIGTLLLSLNFVRPFGLAISDWFYFAALALALIETLLVDRKNTFCWTHNRFIWMASVILFGAILSTFRSINLATGIFEIVQQLYVITLFISLIWVMVKRGKTNIIVQAFILSGVFAASVATVDYFAGTNFGLRLSGFPVWTYWGRFTGPLGHPNKLGYFLVITTILNLAWLMHIKPIGRTTIHRVFWALLFFVQVFGIYLSGSLTAYLGLALGIAALLVSSKLILRRILRIAIPTLLVGIVIISAGIFSRTISLPGSSLIGNSLITDAINRVQNITGATRLDIYFQALGEILNNPWVGAGYDQISTSGISLETRSLQGTIHNVFLQTFYTGGIFSFLGWLAIYISIGWMALLTLRSGKRIITSPLSLGIAAIALSILLMDQFQDALIQREKWLAIGLFVGWFWMNKVKIP